MSETHKGTNFGDLVLALETAANTICDVSPADYEQLIAAGVDAVGAERTRLKMRGNVLPMEPGFMSDMPTLARMVGREEAVEVPVGAGMLLLAAEIARLHELNVEEG